MTNSKPGKNDPCPCQSGLKYKCCHGDPVKNQLVKMFANRYMAQLITKEKEQKGMIESKFKCNSCEKGFNEPISSNVLEGQFMCPHCNSVDYNERNNDGTS